MQATSDSSDSAALAATVLATMPAAVTRCSADLRYLWVSDRCASWLGLSAAEIVGKPLVEILGEDAMATIRPFIDEVLAGKRVEFETTVPYKQIGPRCVQVEYSPTFDGSGAVDGWVACVLDVTERKRAQDTLSAAHRALARLFELSVMPADKGAMPALLQATVDAAIELTGADMGNLRVYDEETGGFKLVAHRGLERGFLEHFAVSWHAASAVAEAVRNRTQVVIEDVAKSSLFDRAALAVLEGAGVRSLLSAPMVSRDGRLVGFVTTHWRERRRPEADRRRALEILSRQATDALEHRRQEERLREAEKKDEFLAMLGHELRNPLAPIVTATEVMALRGGGFMEKERSTIERQAKHLIRLVDDLLDVARITRGKLELRREPVSLEEIVTKAVEVASPLLEERSHRLSIDVAPSLVVEADPARMVQVVANLLRNAAVYTDPGGDVRVSGQSTDETVVLRVIDTGIGIAATMLPVIFEPFVQEKHAIHRPRGGLGLGLSIVRTLVELHGGTVSACSGGHGKGSEFTITLPRSRRERETRAESSRREFERRSSSACILVVDDNEDAAQMLADGLGGLGHDVHIAHDGPEALRLVEQVRPTMCLIDIGLPEMDGYELARRLRQMPSLSDVSLIAVSGYGAASAKQRSVEAGFEAHLVKPVELDFLDKMARGAPPTGG
jgi:PAS domain S-box-containing protein